jgi:hypothetical protein
LRNLSKKSGTFGINGAFFSFIFTLYPYWSFVKRDKLLSKKIKYKYENIKLKKRMPSGSSLTSKLYDKIIKMPYKSHETIPLTIILTAHGLQYKMFLKKKGNKSWMV